jgi:hypothetical protein
LAAGAIVRLTVTLAGVNFPINGQNGLSATPANAGFAVSLPTILLGPTMSRSN